MADQAPVSKKGRKVRKRGKKQRKGKKHSSVKIWSTFDGPKRKGQPCPRCGPGTLLAAHKNRKYCGKCGYTEIKTAGK